MAWNTNEEEAGKIRIKLPDGNTQTENLPLTSSRVQEIARSVGLSTFLLKDSSGEELDEVDFPIEQENIDQNGALSNLTLERLETPKM